MTKTVKISGLYKTIAGLLAGAAVLTASVLCCAAAPQPSGSETVVYDNADALRDPGGSAAAGSAAVTSAVEASASEDSAVEASAAETSAVKVSATGASAAEVSAAEASAAETSAAGGSADDTTSQPSVGPGALSWSFVSESSNVFLSNVNDDAGGVTMEMSYGYRNTAKSGHKLPVSISIANQEGKAVRGTLLIEAPGSIETGLDSFEPAVNRFSRAVEVPAGGTVTVDSLISVPEDSRDLRIRLVGEDGETLREIFSSIDIYGGSELLIGILSDRAGLLDYFSGVSVGQTALTSRTIELDPATMPENAVELEQLDMIIISGFSMNRLDMARREAIEEWNANGGVLLVGSGSDRNIALAFSGGIEDFAISQPHTENIDMGMKYSRSGPDGAVLELDVCDITMTNGIQVMQASDTAMLTAVIVSNGVRGFAACDLCDISNFCSQEISYTDELLQSLLGHSRIERLANAADSSTEIYDMTESFLGVMDPRRIPGILRYVLLAVLYLAFIGGILYFWLRGRGLEFYYHAFVVISAFAAALAVWLTGSGYRRSSLGLSYAAVREIHRETSNESGFMRIFSAATDGYFLGLPEEYELYPVVHSASQEGGRNAAGAGNRSASAASAGAGASAASGTAGASSAGTGAPGSAASSASAASASAVLTSSGTAGTSSAGTGAPGSAASSASAASASAVPMSSVTTDSASAAPSSSSSAAGTPLPTPAGTMSAGPGLTTLSIDQETKSYAAAGLGPFAGSVLEFSSRNISGSDDGIRANVRFFNEEISGTVTNGSAYYIDDAAVLIYGRIIRLGTLAPGSETDLGAYTAVVSPTADSEAAAAYITGLDSFAEGSAEHAEALRKTGILRYYMRENLESYYSGARLIGFSRDEALFDGVSSNMHIEAEGILLKVCFADLDLHRARTVWRNSLSSYPAVISGAYDTVSNTAGGPVVLEYDLGSRVSIGSLYFADLDTAFGGGSISAFSGQISLYNYRRGNYEYIGGKREFTGMEIRPYLSPSNTLTVRYLPDEGAAASGRLFLPVPCITGVER